MAATASTVVPWILATRVPISSVALAVWVASDLHLGRDDRKARPASPARAASIVALSASRLVWLGDALDQRDDFADVLDVGQSAMRRSVRCASVAALPAISADSPPCGRSRRSMPRVARVRRRPSAHWRRPARPRRRPGPSAAWSPRRSATCALRCRCMDAAAPLSDISTRWPIFASKSLFSATSVRARCSLAACSAACSSVRRLACARPSRNTWTACAIAPISSRRSVCGMSASRFPSETCRIAAVMPEIGREMPAPDQPGEHETDGQRTAGREEAEIARRLHRTLHGGKRVSLLCDASLADT